jgi:hypothetical protein
MAGTQCGHRQPSCAPTETRQFWRELSDVDQGKWAARDRSELLHLGSVRRDNGTASTESGFSHGGIDGTYRIGQSAPECAGSLGLLWRESFDLASVEQACQVGLATTTPGLDDAPSGHDWKYAPLH